MNFAFVLLTDGPFGGAQRRFFNLFFYLKSHNVNNYYFFATYSLLEQVKEIYPEMELNNIIPIGQRVTSDNYKISKVHEGNIKIKQIHNLIRTIKKTFFYKFYAFFKYLLIQKHLFREINHYKNEYYIQVFIGIFNGIIPLYFYLKQKSRNRPGIIFSNMDGSFSNISDNPKRDWYKKYNLFNYAHEKADYVDFLSPHVLDGVRKRGIIIPDKHVIITACSFTDYSKCMLGKKDKFRIAFVGRLEKVKSPLMFLDAALVIAKEYTEVEFHIVGEGRMSNNITETIKKSGLTNIIYHGFHPNPVEILSETSLFVSIQTNNNYPSQSVLEAMACRNAIIATDVGDTRIFVNERNGTLIPLDLNALIKAIRDHIENPVMTKEKGLFAANFVQKEFTIEKAANYYIDLLEKVVKNKIA